MAGLKVPQIGEFETCKTTKKKTPPAWERTGFRVVLRTVYCTLASQLA